MFGEGKLLFIERQRKNTNGVTSYVQHDCLSKYISEFDSIDLTSYRLDFSQLLRCLLAVIINSVVVKDFRRLSWYKWLIHILSFLVKRKVDLLAGESRIHSNDFILILRWFSSFTLRLPFVDWFRLCLRFLLGICMIEKNIIKLGSRHSN